MFLVVVIGAFPRGLRQGNRKGFVVLDEHKLKHVQEVFEEHGRHVCWTRRIRTRKYARIKPINGKNKQTLWTSSGGQESPGLEKNSRLYPSRRWRPTLGFVREQSPQQCRRVSSYTSIVFHVLTNHLLHWSSLTLIAISCILFSSKKKWCRLWQRKS